MSENVALVGNEEDVRRFHRLHIAPYANCDRKNLAFLLTPVARKKYHDELARCNHHLSSEIFHPGTTDDAFVRLLRRYEVPSGVFVDSKGVAIPPSAIAMYMTVNALDEVKAYVEMQHVLNLRLYDMSRNVSTPAFKVSKAYKSALHKSALSHFVKYDVDSKESKHIDALRHLLAEYDITIHLVVETRGGYHLIIDNRTGYATSNKNANVARIALKNFVDENKDWISQENSQSLIAIPGTYQGGFLTRIADEWIQ